MLYVAEYITRNNVYIKLFFNVDTDNFEMYRGDEVNTDGVNKDVTIIHDYIKDVRLLNIFDDMTFSSEYSDVFAKALAITRAKFAVKCSKKREKGEMYYSPIAREDFLLSVNNALLMGLLYRYEKLIHSQNKFKSNCADFSVQAKRFSESVAAVNMSTDTDELKALATVGESIVKTLTSRMLCDTAGVLDTNDSTAGDLVLIKKSPTVCSIYREHCKVENMFPRAATQVTYHFLVEGGHDEFKNEVSLHKKDICSDAVDFVFKCFKRRFSDTGNSEFNVQRKHLNTQRIKINKVKKEVLVTVVHK